MSVIPRCPTCGSVLQIRSDEDPYVDRYGDPERDAKGWMSGGWLSLISFASFIAFRLLPWFKRHRWCPRCQRTVA